MINKLLRRSSSETAVRKLPGVCLRQKLLCRHCNTIALCKCSNNILEFLLVGCTEINPHAKTVNQGELLLHSIGGMQIFIVCHLQLIPGFLPNKMTSVAGCIDQDVVRLFLKTALDHCFQIFIFDFKFLKGKIIHIKNKFVITVFDLCDHIIQILKLVLVHLDNAKSFVIITVQDTFDAGRFASSCITKKQAVIGLSSSYKSLRVLDQLLLGDFISNQIIQIHMGDSGNRCDHRLAILAMLNTKCLVQSQLTYAEIFVELHHICHKLFHCRSLCQCFAHITDSVADTLVVYLAVASCIHIITEKISTVCSKRTVKNSKIKVIKFFENSKIMKSQMVNASLHCPSDLGSGTECILVIDQKLRQISVPQIPGKPIHSCHFHQASCHMEKFLFPILKAFFTSLIAVHQ